MSTFDQQPENQLAELRQYSVARGWTAVEYVDRGVSGSKERRPALDQLVVDARRRKFDVLLCWRLDRLGRNLRHLVTLIDELGAVGVAFYKPRGGHRYEYSGRASATPHPRSLGAVRERAHQRKGHGGPTAGQGAKHRLGRPKGEVPLDRLATVAHLSLTEGAATLGTSRSTLKRLRRGQKSLAPAA